MTASPDTPSDVLSDGQLTLTCSQPGSPPDILLFRHAATDMDDGPRRYIGRTEVPLSAEGRAQAAAWQSRLAALDVVEAYASPLNRALDTARLMLGQGNAAADTGRTATGATRIPLTVLDDLAEMHLGEWEGLPQAYVRQGSPDAYAQRGQEPWTFRPPGGECCADVAARGVRALDAIWRGCGRLKRHTVMSSGCAAEVGAVSGFGGFVLAVSHAGLIRSVLCAMGRIGHAELLTLPVRHLQCVRLRRLEAGWDVVSPDWVP